MPPSTPEDFSDLFRVAASASASASESAPSHDPISAPPGLSNSLTMDPAQPIDYTSPFATASILNSTNVAQSSAVNPLAVAAAAAAAAAAAEAEAEVSMQTQSQQLALSPDTLNSPVLTDGADSNDNGSGPSSRKRGAPAANSTNAAEDKKARERKRVMRNRELARVSNERRKGRIKAMEAELDDTRQTVTSLEESIRTLEAENSELKTLLDRKNN